eukprot:387592_1
MKGNINVNPVISNIESLIIFEVDSIYIFMNAIYLHSQIRLENLYGDILKSEFRLNGICELFRVSLPVSMKISNNFVATHFGKSDIRLKSILDDIEFDKCPQFTNKLQNIVVIDAELDYNMNRNQYERNGIMKLRGKLKTNEMFNLFLKTVTTFQIIKLLPVT